MFNQTNDKILTSWQERWLALAVTGVPVALVLLLVPSTDATHTAALVVGTAAGILLLVAALIFYFYWLTTPSRRHSWTSSAMVVLGFQVLSSSAAGFRRPPIDTPTSWGLAIDLVATGVVLGLLLIGGRALRNPQPLVVGLVLGLALTVLHLANPASAADPSSPVIAGTLMLLIVIGQGVIATMVLRDRALTDWARQRLALTIVLVGVAHLAGSATFATHTADLAATTAQAVAALLWISATFVMLRNALGVQHRRAMVLEGSLFELESTLRGNREQLHEIRSTVAGAASASRLLDDKSIPAATHARLETAIRTELDRLERLVSGQAQQDPGPVDVDATLDVLLESHRAQGRTITWQPSGASVHATSDDVAEALNILLDNAATHGGTASRVEVSHAEEIVEIAVTDEGPGVPPESREVIFDWGVHGESSPGQGIGLSVARRLVSEHGGTLTLAEPSAARGSSFIIRLPAARRSIENHVGELGHPA